MKSNDIEEIIANTLLKLISEKDYQKIKISEIVNGSNISRVTFYRHFHNKEEVLYKYLESLSQKYIVSIKKYIDVKDYHSIIDFIFMAFKENLELFKLMKNSNLDYIYMNLLSDKFKTHLEKITSNSFLSYFVAGAIYDVSMKWLEEDCFTPIETISEPFHVLNEAYKKLGSM